MTVRERVIAGRLIQKITGQSSYAQQIGLSYKLRTVESCVNETKFNGKEEKKN